LVEAFLDEETLKMTDGSNLFLADDDYKKIIMKARSLPFCVLI
jgi:hypothetical protein